MTPKEIRNQIIEAAESDASLFHDEFPGQEIRGDWDSAAWQETKILLELSDDEADLGWPLYLETLHESVRRLNSRNIVRKMC